MTRTPLDKRAFGRLHTTMRAEHRWGPQYTQRVLEQTLTYLTACAKNPDTALTPAPHVDAAWTTFILDTRLYVEWCRERAGFYIHRAPARLDDITEAGPDLPGIQHTVRVIQDLGYKADLFVWGMGQQPGDSIYN